jgi:hypothetical protein
LALALSKQGNGASGHKKSEQRQSRPNYPRDIFRTMIH